MYGLCDPTQKPCGQRALWPYLLLPDQGPGFWQRARLLRVQQSAHHWLCRKRALEGLVTKYEYRMGALKALQHMLM